MAHLFFFLFLFPFLFVPSLHAADTNDSLPQPRTIEELVNTTLKNHPTIKASRQMLIGAGAQVDAAKWNYFPTPSIELSQGSGRQGTTLRLDQPLWTGGKIDATHAIAVSKKTEAELVLDENAYSLIGMLLSISQSYQQAQGNISVLEEGNKQLEGLQAMLERRIDAGVSSLADRELVRSRLSQLQADLDVAITRRETARAQIELISGDRLGGEIAFDGQTLLNQRILPAQIIQEMKASHPSLKKFAAQIQTSQAERDKAKAVLWPNISLRVEHLNGSVYTDAGASESLVYLALQMSPGAGLSAVSGIQAAEAKVLQAEFEKMSKERDLTDGILRDYNEYHASSERIEGMNKTISSSQNVFNSYTRLFIAGKRQWLDLVNASRELTQYKLILSDLKTIYAVSAYQLALKRGEIKFESGK